MPSQAPKTDPAAQDPGLPARPDREPRFLVLVDGQKKAETPIMRPKQVHELVVDVKGAKEITLRVLNGGDGYGYDHAVWGLARFLKAGTTDPF